jgi:outer membrane receptor protein involved in Fe transport
VRLAEGSVGALALALIAAPAAAREESRIVVTGTRIPGADQRALEPAVVTPHERLEDRALTNIADVLNEEPGTRGSVTPAGSQNTFGQGVNFVALYGLGTQRTLTLVDGRRMVSSNVPSAFTNAAPGTQVDLNAIPTILVDRVERVAVGGAPVYGTDAIAGTVNVILRRRLTGLETRASSGITSRGDNHRSNLAAAGGVDFAGGRGNLTAAISHDRTNGVIANARDFYRTNVATLPNPCTTTAGGTCNSFGLARVLGPAGRSPESDGRVNPGIGFNDSASDGFPAAVLVRDVRLPAMSNGGVLSSGLGAYAFQFAPDGSLVPYSRGVLFGAPLIGPLAAGATASGGDGLALADYVQITSGLKRTHAALFATFDLSDRITLFADGLYYHGVADELVQQPSFNGVLFSGISGPLTFRTDNPFLSAQVRQQLAALGYTSTFQVSRANPDLADLTGWSDSKLHRIVAGARGKLQIAGREWRYEASFNWGRSLFTDHGQTIDQQRFVNAVNVVEAGGRILCSTAPTVVGLPGAPVADPACQPLNLFGAGAPSAAALAYIRRDTVSRTRLNQFVVNAHLGGDAFDLFGNPVSFNLGFEHHSERATFTPDPFLQAGLGRSVAIAPTEGGYALDELFGEVLLPLVAPDNARFIHRLDLFGRVRQVWNSAGPGFTAWSAGGRLEPVSGVSLRGNFTRSFRAPAIYELYSPRTTANLLVPDLCSPANIGAGPVPAVRRANCTAFLARFPGASPLTAATVALPGIVGGNPDLTNERADSYTFGLALSPWFVPDLTATIDYLDFKITRPIANLSAAQIAQGCFDNPDFDPTDPAHGNGFCSLIGRTATGQVSSDPLAPGVVTGFVNGKRILLSAVQAGLAYRTGLEALNLPGSLDVAADVFHVRRRLSDVTGIAPDRSDGLLTDPSWQGQFRLRYANRAWGLAAQVNYTGEQLITRRASGVQPNDAREFDRFSAHATVDLSLFATTRRGFRLTIAVTNLFDRVGEEYHGVIVPASINDALGRRIAVSVVNRW